MAFQQYFDLYLLAQENKDAPYYVVSFDVVDSRLLSHEEMELLLQHIFLITQYVYGKLLEKEKELNRPVVIHDERFYTPWTKGNMMNSNYKDPSILGDNFEFTVLRDTVTKEEIVKWVYECKKSLHMKEEFHIADGYYETNDYGERTTKFYRGYCLQVLERLHKKEVQEEIEQTRKKLIKTA